MTKFVLKWLSFSNELDLTGIIASTSAQAFCESDLRQCRNCWSITISRPRSWGPSIHRVVALWRAIIIKHHDTFLHAPSMRCILSYMHTQTHTHPMIWNQIGNISVTHIACKRLALTRECKRLALGRTCKRHGAGIACKRQALFKKSWPKQSRNMS